MQVGDLVVLDYKCSHLLMSSSKKETLKIGIVKQVCKEFKMGKVLWSNGDQTWCYPVQLEAVKKCP